MSTHKHIDIICVVIMIIALVGTVVFMNGSKLGIKTIVDEDAEGAVVSGYFTKNDENADWDRSQATIITLDGKSGKVKGNGAYMQDGDLHITQAGYYTVSGNLEEGSIIINTTKSAKVWIALDNVTINCSDDACFRIEQADKVFLTLDKDSTNEMTSGAEYSTQATTDGIDGALFARDDMTINGTGSLKIKGQYQHGIVAKDDLVITGGTIDITSVKDAINVNEHFKYEQASITIDAGDDGIHSEKDVLICSGTVQINRCYEGIEAPTIDILDGDITIYPTDDGLNANGGTSSFGNMGGGFGNRGNKHGQGTGTNGQDNSTDTEGTNTDGKKNFDKGQFQGGHQFDGEAMTDENGEQMTPPDMSQMPENRGEMPNQDSTTADSSNSDSSVTPTITISGGNITIINKAGMDADGIDSNGDIYIKGGNIFISLKGNGSNNAIDYGSESGGICEITGGIVMATGGSSMLEGFADSSTQTSAISVLSETAADNSTVKVTGSDGRELMNYEIPVSFSAISFSCPEMKVGETITLDINGTDKEISLNNVTNQDDVSGRMGMMNKFTRQTSTTN